MIVLELNWRMLEVQAVIGRIQLRRMAEWTKSRQENAAKLDSVASKYPLLRLVQVPEDCEHAEYKHYFFVNPEKLSQWLEQRSYY